MLNDTAGSRGPVEELDMFSLPTFDWRVRTPAPSQSRKASPTRGLLQELRTGSPAVTIIEHYEQELPVRVNRAIHEILLNFEKSIIPIEVKVSIELGYSPFTFQWPLTLD